jgi:hypothetical protein
MEMIGDFTDGPSPFDSLATWERWLERVKALPKNSLGRDMRIRDAKYWIARKRKEQADGKARHRML